MLKRISKFTVSVIMVVLILKIVGIEKLTDNLQSINGSAVLLASFLCPYVVILGTEKWRQIVKHEANASYKEALISFLGGMSLGLVTPARIGEFGRIAFFSKGKKTVLIGIAVVDRLIDIEITLLLGVVGAYYFMGHLGAFVVLATIAVGATIIFMPQTYYRLLNKIINYIPYRKKIEEVMIGVASIPIATLGACFILRLLVSSIDLLQFYILINAFVHTDFIPIIVVYPVIILINIIPITFMGIGMREGTAMLTLSMFGVPPEASVSASFLLFCLNTLLPGLLGTIFVPRIELARKGV